MKKNDTDKYNRRCGGISELYEYFFECPFCSHDYVQENDKYCGQCGERFVLRRNVNA